MAKYPPEYKPLDTNNDGIVDSFELARASTSPNTALRNLAKKYNSTQSKEAKDGYTNNNPVKPSKEPYGPSGPYTVNVEYDYRNQTTFDANGQAFVYVPEGQGLPTSGDVLSVLKYVKETYGNRLWDAIRNAYGLGPDATNTQLNQILTSELQAYSNEMYFRIQDAPEGSYGNQVTFLDWLKGGGSNTKGGGGGGAASPDKFATITGRQEAWQIFKAANKDLLGIIPTKDSFEKYYKELVAKQKTFTQSTTVSGTTQITTSNSLDVNAFTTAFIIKNSNLSGDLKGTAGQYQNWITQTAKSFGLDNKLTPEFTNKYLKGMLTGKYKQDDLTDAFRKQAKVLYTAFSQDLEENPEMTLEEIMQPYINLYANVFELGTNSINLSDVANFASSENGQKIGTYDFEKKLRADERFGYTKQANIEAGNLARSFARAFGVNV